MMKRLRLRGFTLVELVTVIVITAILAATLTIFLKPAIDSYFDTRRRVDLTDIADTALRRMAQDIRSAVPNSIRPGPGAYSTSCFQLVPTIAGGRYRMAPDTINDASCAPPDGCSAPLDVSAPVDPQQNDVAFDVLSPLDTVPEAGDWIVIDNQNTDDVYNGANRAQIGVEPTVPARFSDGLHRITVAATQFPVGYDGGRFVVVDNEAQSVFYSCVNGALYRTVAAFASDVAGNNACIFIYDANQGATQQSGFLWMRLQLARDGESVTLAHGVHVDNVP